MAHSIIEFHSRHFQLNDVDLIVFAELLRNAVLRNAMIPPNIRAMVDWWEDALALSAAGAIDLNLDEFLTNQKSIALVCSGLDDLVADLRDAGEMISADKLNAIARGLVQFTGDRRVEDFQVIAHRFQGLLQCRLT